MKPYDIFAITAPGLEPVCAAELRSLDILPGHADIDAAAGDGGVAWRGDGRSLYRANLECRTASRIVIRAGTFRARTFAELERHTGRLDWSRLVRPDARVALRVTCRKSKLYHEGAVAERIERVLGTAVGAHVARAGAEHEAYPANVDPGDVVARNVVAPDNVSNSVDADSVADDDAAQLITVRFLRDVCTISIDASGALLHQRGYRQAVAKAPLRETLAAAMLLAAGYTGDAPLLDPMCGSGTIPIEGALLARRIAPGLANPDFAPRRYAFQDWPDHDERVWDDVVAAARSRISPASPVPIHGRDRDAGAVTASRANAARAGVADDVRFEQMPLSAVRPPPVSRDGGETAGHLITNPPYGVRVGERRALHALYGAFGRLAREQFGGWTVALLAADDGLAGTTGLPFKERFATSNGGIAVRLLEATVPDAGSAA